MWNMAAGEIEWRTDIDHLNGAVSTFARASSTAMLRDDR
jgi:hypothetical protein